MVIYNVKINSRKFLKFILLLMFIIAFIITGFALHRIFGNNLASDVSLDNVYKLPSSNYTNVLKAVHENIDTYVGQKISFSGYVYRVYDLEKDDFVIARDMIINSSLDTLVVGFLCHNNNSNQFADGTWVNATGIIEKGNYHGDIPIINILKIEEISKPSDSNVYPPDDFYIPTSTLLYNNP